MTAEQIAKAVIGYRIAHKCTIAEARAAILRLIAKG
jgi:hypothetical protein